MDRARTFTDFYSLSKQGSSWKKGGKVENLEETVGMKVDVHHKEVLPSKPNWVIRSLSNYVFEHIGLHLIKKGCHG